MLSHSVPITTVVLPNGQPALMPDWLAASYVRKLRGLPTVKTLQVESHHVGFPELLSFSIYGHVRYWRVLLMYNGIVDWYAGMIPGMDIKVPELTDVESLYAVTPNSKIGQQVTL